MPAREGGEPAHVRHLPIEVHREEDTRPVGNRGLRGRRVERVVDRRDIGHDRRRLNLGNCFECRHEGHRRHHHLVSGADLGRQKRDPCCVEAAGDSDAVLGAAEGRKGTLELRDLGSVREGAAVEQPADLGQQLVFEQSMLRREVEKRDTQALLRDGRVHERPPPGSAFEAVTPRASCTNNNGVLEEPRRRQQGASHPTRGPAGGRRALPALPARRTRRRPRSPRPRSAPGGRSTEARHRGRTPRPLRRASRRLP